jgi:hypothetical protein
MAEWISHRVSARRYDFRWKHSNRHVLMLMALQHSFQVSGDDFQAAGLVNERLPRLDGEFGV